VTNDTTFALQHFATSFERKPQMQLLRDGISNASANNFSICGPLAETCRKQTVADHSLKGVICGYLRKAAAKATNHLRERVSLPLGNWRATATRRLSRRVVVVPSSEEKKEELQLAFAVVT
jgi:hypothetical protein